MLIFIIYSQKSADFVNNNNTALADREARFKKGCPDINFPGSYSPCADRAKIMPRSH